jgi:hypothetical protein
LERGQHALAARFATQRTAQPAASDIALLGQHLAILANNYGEAGALSLYGPQYNLPTPISSTNSFHDRGYGPYDPETVIVVGGELHDQELNFEHCTVAAQVRISYGLMNEESRDHPEILICHYLRRPWLLAWSRSQEFG